METGQLGGDSSEPQQPMSKAKPLASSPRASQLSVRAGMTFRTFFPPSESPCLKNDKTEAQKQEGNFRKVGRVPSKSFHLLL